MKALNKDAQNLRTIYSEEDVDVLENEIMSCGDGSDSGSGSGSGSDQTSEKKKRYERIPEIDDECMLWALTSIVVENKMAMSVVDEDGNKSFKCIDKKFSAKKAYEYLKESATNRVWPYCDVNGNEFTGERAGTYTYTGGEMKPSVARTIGQETGILSGGQKFFKSYAELKSYMENNTEWKDGNHKNGTFMIMNKHIDEKKNEIVHGSVCNGFDENGNLMYRDAFGPHTYNSTDNGSDEWTLIF